MAAVTLGLWIAAAVCLPPESSVGLPQQPLFSFGQLGVGPAPAPTPGPRCVPRNVTLDQALTITLNGCVHSHPPTNPVNKSIDPTGCSSTNPSWAHNASLGFETCVATCCANPGCAGATYEHNSQWDGFGYCVVGQPCCWLFRSSGGKWDPRSKDEGTKTAIIRDNVSPSPPWPPTTPADLSKWSLHTNSTGDSTSFVWRDGTGLEAVVYQVDHTAALAAMVKARFDTHPAKLRTTLAAMEYTLSFRNTASKASHPLCAVNPLDVVFAPGERSSTLYHFEGGDDIRNAFNAHVTTFNSTSGAPVQLVSKLGRSSNGVLPYFAIQSPSGKVLLVSVGWTGQWGLSITSTAAGSRVLLKHPELCAALNPQESLRSFRVFAMWADKLDVQDLFNLHRRFILGAGATHGGKLLAPVAGYLGGGAGSMGGWQTQSAFLSLLNSTDAGVEAFWLDAGWFKGGFPNGVGNWEIPINQTVDTQKWPQDTLLPISTMAKSMGLEFIVWFEPERVATGTYIAKAHPEFVLAGGGDGLLDLGSPTAWSFIYDYLSTCIADYQIDVLRIDYNIDPLTIWQAHDKLMGGSNRSGTTEVKYIEGLYSLWDELLAHPNGPQFIDDCSSGGRRIDFETLHRSIPLWPTDFDEASDPEAFQSHQMGLSQLTSIFGAAAHGFDPYSWRSAGMNGKMLWWTSAWDAAMKVPAQVAQLRQAVQETVMLRPFSIWGDYYPLTPIDVLEPWAAYQLHRHTSADGYIMAFRRSKSTSASLAVSLVDIDPLKHYEVEWMHEFSVNHTQIIGGSAFVNLTITLKAVSKSVLIMYKAQ
eukprot:COSAG02_NODE_1942_length_10310_cov_15.313877_4_plen_812_part_00